MLEGASGQRLRKWTRLPALWLGSRVLRFSRVGFGSSRPSRAPPPRATGHLNRPPTSKRRQSTAGARQVPQHAGRRAKGRAARARRIVRRSSRSSRSSCRLSIVSRETEPSWRYGTSAWRQSSRAANSVTPWRRWHTTTTNFTRIAVNNCSVSRRVLSSSS